MVEVETGLPGAGRREALRQVVAHLLDNAQKYSPEGGVIGITGRCVGEDVLITVADRGIGLPGRHQRVQPFKRGARGQHGRPGTGLGLYIVQSLVVKQGGLVTAVDRDDGTTIEVLLPVG